MVSRDCFRFLKDASRASLKRLVTYQSRSHNYPRGFGIIRISEKKTHLKRVTSCQSKGSKDENVWRLVKLKVQKMKVEKIIFLTFIDFELVSVWKNSLISYPTEIKTKNNRPRQPILDSTLAIGYLRCIWFSWSKYIFCSITK